MVLGLGAQLSSVALCLLPWKFGGKKEVTPQLPFANKVASNTDAPTNLLLSQSQQLLLGLLHLLCGASDGDLVNPRTFGGEVDVHATTLLHDGTHKAPFGANQGVVQFGWDGHLNLGNIGLGVQK